MLMKILEVCVDLDGGGIDRYLLNYCSRIKGIQFDFAIVDKGRVGMLEQPIRDMGSRIYRAPRQSLGVIRYCRSMKKIMSGSGYDAVHIHLGYKSLLPLLCARSCGIRTRIVHSHLAFVPESGIEHLIRSIMTPPVKRLATSLVACGIDSARWTWGERAYEKGLVTIHHNAIPTAAFRYSPTVREKLREELGIPSESLVFGHVGRLCDQKNQVRLIDIFSEIVKREENSFLMLIGSGDREKAVRERIDELHLAHKVFLLGTRNDVNDLLNTMDAFIFPSLYEGLPFTLIETQCNGLPAVSSDIVTPQVRVSDCLSFLPPDSSNALWAEKAIQIAKRGHDGQAWKAVQLAGYDIDVESEKLKAFYTACIEE